jgi:hypothetical protein
LGLGRIGTPAGNSAGRQAGNPLSHAADNAVEEVMSVTVRPVPVPEEWPGVVVDIYGSVRVSCSYATAGGTNDRGYVLLRSPNTLTYCMSSGAVVGCLSSWLLAWEQACPQLPETASAPARPDYRDRVTSAATLEGTPNPRLVKFFDAGRSPTGTAHVLVRTGPVNARVYDQAGLFSFVEGWVAAHEAADAAF